MARVKGNPLYIENAELWLLFHTRAVMDLLCKLELLDKEGVNHLYKNDLINVWEHMSMRLTLEASDQ